MKTRCLIVDDEPLAIDALQTLLERFTNLQVVGSCGDTFQAMELLQSNTVDLMFLDIQMPEVSGLNFLRSLKEPPRVIFTTAYRKYAVEAFELDVVDYLVKPISQQRLMKALDKYFYLKELAAENPVDSPGETTSENDFMYVKADRKMVKVRYDEILFVEGLKDYVYIITDSKNVITRMTMNELESTLPTNKFLRIHRSYIVSLARITAFTQHDVEIGKEELPIGRSHKEKVMKLLESGL